MADTRSRFMTLGIINAAEVDDDDNEETLKALKERKQNRERYTEFLGIQIDQQESEEEAVA